MFGHHNDKDEKNEDSSKPAETGAEVINAGADAPAATDTTVQDDASATPAEPANIVTPDPQPADDAAPEADAAPASAPVSEGEDEAPSPSWQHPGEPLEHPAPTTPEPISDVISPAGGFPKPPSIRPGDDEDHPAAPVPSFPVDDAEPADDAAHELIDIKQHALTELAPLIDELDLPAEEKFRTIMMMIQASDDQSLVKKAYETAHTIEDEKVRAQALLDVVNEVNYFTQPHDQA